MPFYLLPRSGVRIFSERKRPDLEPAPDPREVDETELTELGERVAEGLTTLDNPFDSAGETETEPEAPEEE